MKNYQQPVINFDKISSTRHVLLCTVRIVARYILINIMNSLFDKQWRDRQKYQFIL